MFYLCNFKNNYECYIKFKLCWICHVNGTKWNKKNQNLNKLYFSSYLPFKNCLYHIKLVIAHNPYHVIIYDKCSFLKDILVCPPIGPSDTSKSVVASKKIGSAPVTLHICSKSLRQVNEVYLFLLYYYYTTTFVRTCKTTNSNLLCLQAQNSVCFHVVSRSLQHLPLLQSDLLFLCENLFVLKEPIRD